MMVSWIGSIGAMPSSDAGTNQAVGNFKSNQIFLGQDASSVVHPSPSPWTTARFGAGYNWTITVPSTFFVIVDQTNP